MSQIKIGSLDIGFHNLKGGKTTANSVQELRNHLLDASGTAIEFELFLMPAGACPTRMLPHTLTDDVGGETVFMNGEAWQAGIDFGLTPTINKDYSDAYKHTNEWKALLLAGLKKIGWEELDCLVLGLPCQEYYKHPDAVNDVINLAKGEHIIDVDTVVTVKEVIVLPQPLGSFHGYYMAEPDESQRKILKKALTLVVDPGYGTLDWVVIKKGDHVMQHSAGSTRLSVRAVCTETERLLQAEDKKLKTAPHEIENCIKTGDWEIYCNKKLINIETYFREAARKIGRDAFKKLRSSLSTYDIEPQICILTAGGASIFKDIALEESGADQLLISEYSIYLNVFGYLYEALNQKAQSRW